MLRQSLRQVILVAASCCSAQLVSFATPWVLPSANLISTPQVDAAHRAVTVTTPYIHPYGSLLTPYNYPFTTPYAYSYSYVAKPGTTTLKATEFPYIWQESEPAAEAEPQPENEAEATPAVEEARRRRRDVEAVKVPLPYLHVVPTVAKTTLETNQYEPIEAATPADTTKLEITTKEHELVLPTVKYAQPVVEYKPITYKVAAPAPLTYTFSSLPYSYFPYAYPYAAPATPAIKLDK